MPDPDFDRNENQPTAQDFNADWIDDAQDDGTSSVPAAAATAAATDKPQRKIKLASSEPAATKSNKRQYVLLGILAVLGGALAYDAKVTRPKLEQTTAALSKRSTELNARATEVFNQAEVQRVIGRAPIDQFQDGNNFVEVYGWQRPIPFLKHKLFVVYTPFKGDRMFSRVEPIYEKLVSDENTIASADQLSAETDPMAGMSAMPGMSGGDAMPGMSGGDAMPGDAMPGDAMASDAMASDAMAGMSGGDATAGDAAVATEEVREVAVDQPAGGEATPAVPAPEVPVPAEEPKTPAVDTQSPQYKKIAALVATRDKDGDGVLSGDELSAAMKSRMAEADLDGNGGLDVAEIVVFSGK